ncbi:MAG: hypothetical protein LBU05_06420, partial [Bifidobacteriaceae bacterium]|nr:hypothetical protein [Bifidobacteriaceae bacterium]
MRFEGDPDYDLAFAERGPLTVAAMQTGRVTGAVADRRDMLKTATVTQEMAGDIPDQASLVGGAVSARAELAIDGAMPNAPDPFSRASRLDWIGSRMALAAGYLGDTLPVFTGNVREIQASESARTRQVSLVDPSDGMRGEVTLPPFGSYAPKLRPDQAARCPTNAAAIIVAALHANGIRVTPKPAAGAVISVPMAFGALAEVGWTRPSGPGVPEGTPWLAAGKF